MPSSTGEDELLDKRAVPTEAECLERSRLECFGERVEVPNGSWDAFEGAVEGRLDEEEGGGGRFERAIDKGEMLIAGSWRSSSRVAGGVLGRPDDWFCRREGRRGEDEHGRHQAVDQCDIGVGQRDVLWGEARSMRTRRPRPRAAQSF